MSQAPYRNHDTQRVLWDHVVKNYGFPQGYEGRHVDEIFGRPFEHVIPINHAIDALVKRNKPENKKLVITPDPTYDRMKYELVSSSYVAVQDGQQPVRLSVDISNLVYPGELIFISASKTGPAEPGDETKGPKNAHKKEPNIPVVFMTGDKSVTRHYQAEMPNSIKPGSTIRVFDTLPTDIYAFITDGTLPPEPKVG